jgi:ketosteroid isomerase-like protein
MKQLVGVRAGSATLFLFLATVALGQSPKVQAPVLKPQPSPRAVVSEHLDALNHCDFNRLMAQYPGNAELFFPGGNDVIGRANVAKLFSGVVKPLSQGGVCGLRFEEVRSLVVGNTVIVHWRVVGDALAKPYEGTDAYVTRNGLMVSQVSTFQAQDLQKKEQLDSRSIGSWK